MHYNKVLLSKSKYLFARHFYAQKWEGTNTKILYKNQLLKAYQHQMKPFFIQLINFGFVLLTLVSSHTSNISQ